MSWQGDINNPVPSGIDFTKENPIVKNTKVKAFDTRRDTDERKDFTVTLIDIDTTLLDYLQNVINLSVIDAGQSVKVPIMYGSPERWKAAQIDGFTRDQQGKLQLPAIMFKRNSFSKNENIITFNRYLTYPVISKYTEKNKYTKFSTLNDTVVPVNQIHAVTLPDHVKLEYEFIVWTEYVEQMNGILEKINFASEDYWGDPQRLKFRVSINDYSHTVEVNTDSDRMVKTNFVLSVFAYLLPESFEDRKSTVQKLLTPKKINITAELVSSTQMKNYNDEVRENSLKNKSNPYYLTNDNLISHDKDSWKKPKLAIKSEITSDEGDNVVERIRQSYAALIQQTIHINSETTGSSGGSGIQWVDAPTSAHSPGNEGDMAYDDNYHYIYVAGKWRRHALADYE